MTTKTPRQTRSVLAGLALAVVLVLPLLAPATARAEDGRERQRVEHERWEREHHRPGVEFIVPAPPALYPPVIVAPAPQVIFFNGREGYIRPLGGGVADVVDVQTGAWLGRVAVP